MNKLNVTAREATLEAAKACLRAAGYDEESVDRAIVALDGREEDLPSPDQLLTSKDVCKWLGISLSTLWRWNIPHVKISGLRRFYRHDVEEFLNSRYVREPKDMQNEHELPRQTAQANSAPSNGS